VDWKVSARHDRYFTKRYTEDTALSVYLVVDRSASMRQASGPASKYLHAARFGASLAYLALRQRDGVGLALASSREVRWLPARFSQEHLVRILQALATADVSASDGLEQCLSVLLDRREPKGLIVVVSDFMYAPAPVQKQLGRLQAQGHEILPAMVKDPQEEDFPFNRWVRFGDLENAAVRHRVDTVPLKKAYHAEYRALVDEWRRWAKRYACHMVCFRTDQPVETVLPEYLEFRRRSAL
jgi:uncharacterized protein (DUF58 family)